MMETEHWGMEVVDGLVALEEAKRRIEVEKVCLRSWREFSRRKARELEESRQRHLTLLADRDTLRQFFEAMALDVWGFSDFGGGDIQDRAVEMGLLVEVPADEAFQAEYDSDTMYTWSWSALAAKEK